MFTVLRAPSVAAILAVVLAATLATAAHAQQGVASIVSEGVASIVSRDLFEQMLLHRNDVACPAHGFYTYDAFLAAAAAFPSFGTTGSTETRKREVAAFFGQTSHETTGGWATAPDGPYSWGYCFKQEQSPGSSYCQPSSEWPCAPGKQYYGRGPIQISWNYNYGQAGGAIGVDLLNNPDLVATDPTVSFKTAMWFWMTAQANKPSCHDVITDQWRPTDADNGAGRAPGYGVITNIINGGLECGRGQDSRVEDRIGFYKRYCDILGVGYGSNLDCYHQRPFSSGLSAWLSTAAHAQQGVASIVSRDLFEQMLLHRNDAACPAHGFYTYDAFLAAAAQFPSFGTTGSTETRKREVAAFFGQTSHETTGGWATAPDGPYSWGYCFKQEQNPGSSYCQPSSEWPCVPGKQYYGRGPIQISWNYNYGPAGRAIGVDLLNKPDLVETDPTVSFKTALWFWMTAQANKPSCHDVITDQWRPSDADNGAGRVPGYGLITNIINGGLECGRGQDSRVEDRIGFYKRYCDILVVSYGSNLDCYNQRPFSSGLSAWLAAQ